MKKILLLGVLILLYIAFGIARYYGYIPFLTDKVYYATDFGIEVIKSPNDKDDDGLDDFSDILEGAKITAENHVKYKSAYYGGGYPPVDEGVCTDVIWRSLLHAGYNLKDLVDLDIRNNVDLYPRTNGKPDPNIDFRRVPNLKVFFERHAIILTNDINKIEEWMPGDIVIFEDVHIGIISDKRTARGVPYLIHNTNQPRREEPVLERRNYVDRITGHYRVVLN